LTDFTYRALISDVIVKPDYRGKGLGKGIIERILKLPPLSNVTSFELYCPENISGFYENIGFKEGTSKLLCIETDSKV